MADNEDFHIDPAVAAAMGFSGFGAQPGGKKRKFDTDDAFVDPDVKATSARTYDKGKGANNVPLGARVLTKSSGGGGADADNGSTMQQTDLGNRQGRARVDLQALRQGVKNRRGDMVYFLPSFIEDPWKGLKAQ